MLHGSDLFKLIVSKHYACHTCSLTSIWPYSCSLTSIRLYLLFLFEFYQAILALWILSGYTWSLTSIWSYLIFDFSLYYTCSYTTTHTILTLWLLSMPYLPLQCFVFRNLFSFFINWWPWTTSSSACFASKITVPFCNSWYESFKDWVRWCARGGPSQLVLKCKLLQLIGRCPKAPPLYQGWNEWRYWQHILIKGK